MKTARKVSFFTYSFFWHGKHEWIHILLGLMWLIFLTKVTSYVYTNVHILLAIVGSLAPDLEHIIYLFIRKRNSEYTKTIKMFIKHKQFIKLIRFFEKHHKHETYLPFHHILTPVFFLVVCIGAYQFDKVGTLVFMGAGVSHYIFDIVDDLIFLRKLNPNWTRGIRKVLLLKSP